jgi:hypothetical protein
MSQLTILRQDGLTSFDTTMKTPASLVLAIKLAHSAATTAANANLVNKASSASSSLRGTPASAPRHLQVPSNTICFTHLGYYPGDAAFPYQTACTPGLLSQCHPFDASNCVADPDEDDDVVFKHLDDVRCPTFVVWPTGDYAACKWAYACC